MPPHSFPNYAAAAIIRQVQSGQFAGFAITAGSPYRTFDLRSFYFGLVVSSVVSASVPVGGSVRVIGTTGGPRSETVEKIITFNPPTVTGFGGTSTTATMKLEQFGSEYTNMVDVRLEVIVDPLAGPDAADATVLLFDTLGVTFRT